MERIERLQQTPVDPIRLRRQSTLELMVRELTSHGDLVQELEKVIGLYETEDRQVERTLLEFDSNGEDSIAGREVTIMWEASVPSEAELVDLAFVIEEGLGCRFHEGAVTSWILKGAPETDESYLARAVYLAPRAVRLRPFCTAPRSSEQTPQPNHNASPAKSSPSEGQKGRTESEDPNLCVDEEAVQQSFSPLDLDVVAWDFQAGDWKPRSLVDGCVCRFSRNWRFGMTT